MMFYTANITAKSQLQPPHVGISFVVATVANLGRVLVLSIVVFGCVFVSVRR